MNKYSIRLIFAILIQIILIAEIIGIMKYAFVSNFQFLPLLQRLFNDFSIVTLCIIISIFLITILFGRIYCSTICPFGVFQEILKSIIRQENKFKKKSNYKNLIAVIIWGLLIGGTVFISKYLDPYSLFANIFSLTFIGIIAICIFIGSLFIKGTFFCSNICPIGTILGIISKYSMFKIKFNENNCINCQFCEKSCPTGSINIQEKYIDNETCIRCFKCTQVCSSERIELNKTKKNEKSFNLKRRDFIVNSSILLLLTPIIKAGDIIKDTISEKITNKILPAGAKNAKRMLNTCLNCNLCIQHCPNKILKKADSDFQAVHIDYSKGCCEYDCIECSKVCPAGAIKKISLEEKQHTKIATINIITFEHCLSCRKCISFCPTNALSFVNDRIKVDDERCIGCGKCKYICIHDAIIITSIDEQKLI